LIILPDGNGKRKRGDALTGRKESAVIANRKNGREIVSMTEKKKTGGGLPLERRHPEVTGKGEALHKKTSTFLGQKETKRDQRERKKKGEHLFTVREKKVRGYSSWGEGGE